MTPHISSKFGEIAKEVLLFGDPVRCRRAAEKFLTGAKEVSSVRGAVYFTGKYRGREVTFGTSGMGTGSMGIYSYELFAIYDVDTIIRVGTSGAYSTLHIGDKVLVSESIPDTPTFSELSLGKALSSISPSPELKCALKKSAEKLGIKLHECRTHSTDLFYFIKTLEQIEKETFAPCVEMESYALFVNAARTNKKAACILSITDSIYEHEHLTIDERLVCCDPLIEIALGIEV